MTRQTAFAIAMAALLLFAVAVALPGCKTLEDMFDGFSHPVPGG